MRRRPVTFGAVASALALAAITGCADTGTAPTSVPTEEESMTAHGPGTTGSGLVVAPDGSTTPLSPRDLQTLARPTAPPTVPTDVVPSDVVAGRVSAIAQGCTDVTTDDDEVWSLAGDPGIVLMVGDTIRAKVEPLDEGETACGAGAGRRLVWLARVE
ncbi:hypothetical protein [Demequina sp. NBRC 110054]|uniref:hypothetical protein n=1 Tax=Demequina sp. NBRC 110054 TaxID=1570343 RepID=UPI000A061FF2|nr:hypothetical protein [Demequina sp. NBRC 110054]